jgi:hypothetical protein
MSTSMIRFYLLLHAFEGNISFSEIENTKIRIEHTQICAYVMDCSYVYCCWCSFSYQQAGRRKTSKTLLLSVEKINSSKTASGPPPKALSRLAGLYKFSEKRQQKGKQRRNRISEVRVLEQARQVRRPSPKENITKTDVEEAPEQSQVIRSIRGDPQ